LKIEIGDCEATHGVSRRVPRCQRVMSVRVYVVSHCSLPYLIKRLCCLSVFRSNFQFQKRAAKR